MILINGGHKNSKTHRRRSDSMPWIAACGAWVAGGNRREWDGEETEVTCSKVACAPEEVSTS